MKFSDFDYKNYDTISVSVKSQALDEVLECYKSFGWVEKIVEEDSKYGDLVTVSFLRDHKIANKDKLQLMQVQMEKSLNKLGSLTKYKYAVSTAIGMSLGLIGCIMIALGLVLALVYTNIANIVCGSLIAVLGLCTIIFFFIRLGKLHKKEDEQYGIRYQNVVSGLKKLCDEARALWWDNNAIS